MKIVRCECSRCKLYIRAENVEDPTVALYLLGIEKTQFEHREYQAALIELSKQQNIVACLPTGSGKTFIAYKLIQHYQPEIEKESNFPGEYNTTCQPAGCIFCTEYRFPSEAPHWRYGSRLLVSRKWAKIIDGFHILAMTSQIFLNLLRHAYITFPQIVLMVFDECHHAVKDHPMNVIMKEYRLTKDKSLGMDYPMPRILGLTATVIKGTCRPSEVPEKVQELEQIMYSKAVTYKDYEEVMQHSTSAEVIKLEVPNCSNYHWYPDDMIKCLDNLSKSLQELRKERKKAKLSVLNIEGIDPCLRNVNNVYLSVKKPSAGDLKTALDDVRHIYKDLGPYCAVIAINLRLAFIQFSLMDLNDGTMKSWYNNVQTFLQKLKITLTNIMEYVAEDQRALHFASPKLKLLINSIKNKFGPAETRPECPFEETLEGDQNLCGLVFVERRATAQVLSWYLQDLSSCSKDYNFIKASFVVGTSHSPFETVESRVYARKQTETINGFRMKKFNLLVATSVLEEGIDVPSCNLVVRFDRIQTYTSYVQSMGRARKSGAFFYAFIDGVNSLKQSADLDNFKRVHTALVQYLKSQVEKIDVDYSRKLLNPFEPFEPFQPGGTLDSPRITLDSAVEIVDRYCMLLPCDGIVSLQTISWWESTSEGYIAQIKLPMNSVLKRTIRGLPMKTKELARHAGFFEVAKDLYEAKALDESFVPIHPSFPLEITDFFERELPTEINDIRPDEENVDKPKPIVFEVNREWFKKQIPKLLNPLIEATKNFKLYRISLKLTTANEKYAWKNLYDTQLQTSLFGFGILTAQPLPEVGAFPIFGGFGTINVELEEIPCETLVAPSKLLLLNDFQYQMFKSVLGISSPFLTKFLTGDKNICTVVPLKKSMTGNWSINEDMLKRKLNFGIIEELLDIQMTRRYPSDPQRENQRIINPERTYGGSVVVPWYKPKPHPLYLVDTVEPEMTPMSKFHDRNFANYKHFYSLYFKQKIYNSNQPMLKCKLAGVGKQTGKALTQMNYLLQKHAKEDEVPVYLVPELCHVFSQVSAAFFIQLKLIPSVLHRLSRLLICRETLEDITSTCGWTGALNPVFDEDGMEVDNDENGNMERYKAAQKERTEKLEERRKKREDFRKRFPNRQNPIPKTINIEHRLLHYEFIHPNKITDKNIALFHEAVSTQHAAKKLTRVSVVEVADNDLSPPSKIELMEIGDVDLPVIDLQLNLETDPGPSLLPTLEALTVPQANDGVSFDCFKEIGATFLSYAISAHAFVCFPAWSEPLLCQLRNRLLTLQYKVSVGKKRGIGELLSGGVFYPNDTWIPPGLDLIPHVEQIAVKNKIHFGVFDGVKDIWRKSLAELESYVTPERVADAAKTSKTKIKTTTFSHTELNDFDIAGGIEALVGCFFTQSGPQGAFYLLKWLGFSVPDGSGESIPLGTKFEFNCKYAAEPPEEYDVTLQKVHRLFPKAEKLEQFLGYTFKDKRYLLEAFTHPSYPANVLLDCYQRLEFLGDAVLDLLLTNHVYTMLPKHYTLEQLEDIRAALVNNITYSSLSVRYGFHKHLLSMSQPLVDMIDNFVVHQETVNHRVVGHFTLISDEECWGPKHMEVPKVLGDVFEALAGAIFIDSDRSLDAVWKVFYRLMQHEIDEFTEAIPTSPFRELKAKFGDDMKFAGWTSKKIRARGREMVKISVSHHGHMFNYFGSGTNRARAKQAAAKIALKMIKEDDENIAKHQDLGNTIVMFV